MVGFITAVGVNIVLGQLARTSPPTAPTGSNPPHHARSNALLHPGRTPPARPSRSACSTVALILLLERTPLGPLGLVVAVIATSAGLAIALGRGRSPPSGDLGAIPRLASAARRPRRSRSIPTLLVPAVSLAFVGLVQGAGISAKLPQSGRPLPRRVA